MSSSRHMCTASAPSQAFSRPVYTSGDENTKPRTDGIVPIVLWRTFGGPAFLS